jgi:hypothetical protein
MREIEEGDPNRRIETAVAVEVKRQAWPTPTAGIHRSGQTSEATATKNSRPLQERVERGGQGRLNPAWVEALMGFPAGWTLTDGQPLRDHSTPGSHLEPDPASQTTDSGSTPSETLSSRSAAR